MDSPLLRPEQFGVFGYVIAFAVIFSGIAKLGLDSILVRELVNSPERHAIYLGTALWLKVGGACLVLLILATIIPFMNNGATINMYIFIHASALLFWSAGVIGFYFQAKVLAKITSICKVVQLVLSILIKIYLAIAQAELIWFVLVSIFDALSLAISLVIAYKIKVRRFFYQNFSMDIAKKLLKDSWPLIFSSVAVMICMRIDQIMIKQLLGEHEIGIYSAAVKLSEGLYFIAVLITASLFPAILNAKKIKNYTNSAFNSCTH